MDATKDVPIRDAATIVLWRRRDDRPEVLMGQRGSRAVFMPDKFVFPGGAVDADDDALATGAEVPAHLARPLAAEARTATPKALVHAAIRELWEETGLALARPGSFSATPPDGWTDFATNGWLPDATALRFFFRAVTPPGRPRRFDARFFLAPADAVLGDPDDFSRASDELRHLQWIALSEARNFPLPFVTEVVLAEVAERLGGADPGTIPFFDQGVSGPGFRTIPA